MTTPGFFLNTPHQSGIINHITDGTLQIDSIEEFEEILDIYPDDPLLYRKYADLLMTKGHLKKCLKAYDHAVQLFINNGMNLQAVVAKTLSWSIVKPSNEESRGFQALLHENGSQSSPMQKLWSQMSYAELISIMMRLTRLRLPAGQIVIQHEDIAEGIYFVVSGSLMETLSIECEQKAARQGIETEPLLLGDNDVFGDVFPLDDTILSTTEIRTVTEVELAQIPKSVLVDMCKRYPNAEKLLRSMLRTDAKDKCDRQWKTVRRSKRYNVPTKVEVLFGSTEQAYARIRKTGIAVDLSLTGMCIDLGSDIRGINESRLKGQFVQLRLDLLNDVAVLEISGVIVWQRRQMTQKGSTMLVGIRFDTMDKSDRTLLIEYCTGSEEVNSPLWGLWQTMIDATDKSQE
jgi:CRP-like cAMP-binding protein